MFEFRAGDKVCMTELLKEEFRANLCEDHVQEFGDCVGTVIGLTDFGDRVGPELDIEWDPSGVRYSYWPEDLKPVDEECQSRRSMSRC